MEIIALLKANIKHKKSNFISIFILMMVALMIQTTILSINNNIVERTKKANDEVNTGDYVAFVETDKVTDEMISKLQKSKSVDRVKTIHSFISFETYINDSMIETQLYYCAQDLENKPYGVFNDDGTSFCKDTSELKEGEIYIPLGMKKIFSCSKGDTVSVNYNGNNVTFRIAGFIEEPFTGCDVINMPNLIISEKDFNRIYNDNAKKTDDIAKVELVNIYASKEYKNDINKFIAIANKDSGIIDKSVYSLSKEQSMTSTLLLPQAVCGVMFLFSVILLVVVTLVLSNNVGMSIELDYVNLGILKSQGFSKGRIRVILFIQYLIPTIIGGIIGMIISVFAIDSLRSIFIDVSGILVSKSVLVGKCSALLCATEVFLGLFIYAKTSKVSKISPVRAISGGIEDVHFSSIMQTPVIGKTKRFIGIKLAFRQLTSNIKQYMWSIIILSCMVTYLATCFAFRENFNEQFYNEMFGIVSSDIRVNYGNNDNIKEEVEKEISKYSKIKESFVYENGQFFLDDVSYGVQILDNADYVKKIIDGRAPRHDDEILLATFLSKKINKKTGDKVRIEYGDVSKEFIISGTYDSVWLGGITFVITVDAVKSIKPEYKPKTRNYILEDSSYNEDIGEALDKKFGIYNIKKERANQADESTIQTVMDAVNSVILILYIVAIIFTVIVIWIVCNKSFLKERHDIGVYKAYGFTTISLILQFCFRYMIVALIASVFGLILYVIFGDTLNLTTLMSLGISQYHAPVSLGSLIIPPAIVCFFVLVVVFVAMRKVKNVDSRELIVE